MNRRKFLSCFSNIERLNRWVNIFTSKRSNPKQKLFFGDGNAKLSRSISTFSLPAGHTCPFAKDCLSKANRLTGRIIDGEHCQFRCFATSAECTFPSIRRSRWFNFESLKEVGTISGMANLIQRSLPYGVGMVRIHIGGDFFNEKYFLSWLNVALNNQATVFYAYTKALPFWIKYKKHLPPNFRLTASRGGTHDYLIDKHNLKSAEVVFSTEEARRKGLEIDHDDSHAFGSSDSFALLIHGIQPAGTEAAKAWEILRRTEGGYTEAKKALRMEKPVKIYINYFHSKATPPPLPHRGAKVLA